MWGLFDKHEPMHVAPSNDDKTIRWPHIFTMLCPCSPHYDPKEDMIIHHEIGDA